MKYLLILISLIFIGCTPSMSGRYKGVIVEMRYAVNDHDNNYINVLVGDQIRRIDNYPEFDKLLPGDEVIVECTDGFFSKCYITEKVPRS